MTHAQGSVRVIRKGETCERNRGARTSKKGEEKQEKIEKKK